MIDLSNAIANDAAIRRIQRLQPAGGVGDKLFPPTYPAPTGSPQNEPPRHVFERRLVDGERVWTVLIDSVQSQANRLEESLLVAARNGLRLPYVTVDFSRAGLDPLAEITSLDAPHRVYDAIFRDSLLGTESFMQSEQGRRLASASPADATALLELAPTALVFGAWHSQGEGGGLGAKFARVLVSEIMGINVPVDESPNPRTGEIVAQSAGRRTGSRIDPLGVLRKVEVYKSPTDWATSKDAAGRGAKKVRPSEINHGNIAPTVEPLGVTCAYAEHRAVISLAGLRRLQFGSEDRNTMARYLLLLIGLIALSEQDKQGYALRSRCDLVCDDSAPVELVHSDGSTSTMDLAPDDLRQRYDSAFERAVDVGFEFDSLRLTPQPKLVEIVQQSRKLALEGAGGDDE
ncbi:MAG: type I-U CRISPR-associated RAMP protein Csb1/Cas7u [Gammaproteobacteria bacterium]|nr:type I-U CRISPR-associated RAMP protein Csb1/Cas7u [Gammaproteobacteria bacterium]